VKLEQSFDVAAPLERVWEALVDVERVAPCLPGAAVTGRNDDGSYNGTFKVKIGPTSASYSGRLAMENIDEPAHKATMDAKGTDKRGQGGASATIVSSVSEAGNGSTRVEVVTEYHITGKLARFGRGGMIEDISNKLLGEFAKCLQTSLASPPVSEAPPAPDEASTSDEASASEEPPAPDEASTSEEQPAPDSGDGAEAAAAPPPQPPPPPPPSQPVAESEPVQGLSLMASVVWGQAKRNPAPFVALVLGFLLALRVLRRRS
jgi:uncharacterized protein